MLTEGEEAFFKPRKQVVTVKTICYGATGVDCVEVMDATNTRFYCWPGDLIPLPELQIAPGYLPGPSKEPDTWVMPKIECSHDWRWYDSGWNRFEYCFKCNCERSKRDY